MDQGPTADKGTPSRTHRNGAVALGLSAGLVSAAVMALEVVHHQLLGFFSEYLLANLAINSAIVGMGLGGLVAWAITGRSRPEHHAVAPLLALVSLWVGVWALATIGFDIVVHGALLCLPYCALAVCLSLAYVEGSPSTVYAASLLGSALGTVFVGIFYDRIGAETTLLILSLALATVAILYARVVESSTTDRPTNGESPSARSRYSRWLVVLWVILALASCLNPRLHLIDLLTWSVTLGDHGSTRVHEAFCKKLDRVEFSRWSLEGRVDIISSLGGAYWLLAINGILQDAFSSGRSQTRDDPRLPVPWPDPESNALIIGLSGEGVSKPIRSMVRGKVIGVELNPAIIEAMSGPFYLKSGQAYRGIDVVLGDGRSYVDRCREVFGLITLMNVHPPLSPVGVPEYLFTREAFDRYLALLAPGGFLNIEEVLGPRDGVKAAAKIRILKLLLSSLRASGTTDPDRCVLIHTWSISDDLHYFHFIARRTPFTPAELDRTRRWMVETERTLPRDRSLVYDPTTDGSGAARAFEDHLRAKLGVDLPADRLESEPTDGLPYLHPTRRSMEDEWRVFSQSLLLALPCLVVPLALLSRGRAGLGRGGLGRLAGLALLGTAYLLVELHLIHRVQLLLGSHGVAFPTILGSLFLAGGVGGLVSRRFDEPHLPMVATGLVAVLVGTDLVLVHAVPRLVGWPQAWKLVVSVLMTIPLGVAMGLPFPLGLSAGKRLHGDEFAALAFAANSGLSVAGSGLHLLVAVRLGLEAVWALAVAVYVVALGLLIASRAGGVQGRASPDGAF